MIDRAEVATVARSWLGTPFREQQYVKGAGCDCVGLAMGIGKEIEPTLRDVTVEPWKQSPDRGRMARECDTYLRRVPLDSMQAGDVVLIQQVNEPHHMGILVDYRSGFGIVHALKARGKVVEHRLDSRMRKGIVAAYRYPSVA